MSPKVKVLLLVFLLDFHLILASDPDSVQDFCVPDIKPTSRKPIQISNLPCKNPLETTADDFIFSGIKSAGNFSKTGFFAKSVTPTLFPGLNTLGMSFVRADLDVGGINAPHFHPRATEIAYILEGMVYSGFVDSSNRLYARVIVKGEVMVFPKGLLHFQMNIGDSPATIIGSFNSQNPGLQRIPEAVFGSGIRYELLEKAFGLSAKEVGLLRRRFIAKGKR
ncbi:hypothetical protein AQUCO_00400118v1 [Aquilegia coerulea]|uniref:Germin-like protein n=1 Tax=Aquilegia coerulea TaxID=218851 RepID=A0A2G5ETH3_AQUCA|nr:hypothetical protein AQUCO_00400118v1 [Aquilegia coerulea]